jgi:tetratricopeptide (TPR) repeat protein
MYTFSGEKKIVVSGHFSETIRQKRTCNLHLFLYNHYSIPCTMAQRLKKGQKPREKKDYTQDHTPLIPPTDNPGNTSRTEEEEDIPRDLELAQRLFDKGRISQALDEIRDHIDGGTEKPRYLCIHALMQLALGNNEEASRSINKAMLVASEDAETLRDFSILLTTHGEYEEAEANLESYLAAAGEDAEAYLRGSHIKACLGKDEEGLALCRKGREVVGDDEELIKAEIRHLIELERFSEAEEVIDSLSQTSELTPVILGLKGEVLMYLDRMDEALESLQKGLEADPDSGIVHLSLARIFYASNEPGKALSAIQYSMERGEISVSDLFIKAEIEAALHQYDEAEEDIAAIIEKESRYPGLPGLMEEVAQNRPTKNAGIGYALFKAEQIAKTEDWDGLIEHLNELEGKGFEHSKIHALRGKAHQERGEDEEALEQFMQVIRLEPDQVYGYVYVAGLLYENERYNDLIAFLQGRETSNVELGLLYGLTLINLDRTDEGLRIINDTLLRISDRQGRFDSMVEVAINLDINNKRDEAVEMFTRIVREFPDKPEAQVYLNLARNK